MKNKAKKTVKFTVLALCLGIAATLSMPSAMAQVTVIDSGNCGANGNNLTWTLYSDSTLVISGSGNMAENSFPWYFYRNTITTVVIGDSVENIVKWAFYNYGLTSLTIGNSVKNIGLFAFTACNSLTSITIPENVTSIGEDAFYGCSSLHTVNYNAINCTVKEDPMRLPGMVPSAFYECNTFTTLNIGSKVQTLPTAFYYSYYLTSITSHAISTPVSSELPFNYGVPDTIPVYIPCQSYNSYSNAFGWRNKFSNFINSITDTMFYVAVKYANIPYTDGNFTNLTDTGIYYRTFNLGVGCDSVVCLTLTEIDIPISTNIAVVQSDNTFIITWQGDAALYHLYRNNVFLDTVSTTTYTDNDLTTEWEYCYRVKAIENDYESALCKESCQIFKNVGIVEITNYELDITRYEIYDILGRKQPATRHCWLDPQSNTNNTWQEIAEQVRNDVAILPTGIYIIKLQTYQGTVVKKLIKL